LRYNKNNPYPKRILFLDKGLYDFEMLELHSLSCYYTGRREEGSMAYWTMRSQLQGLGEGFLPEDQVKRLLDNEQYFPRPETFGKQLQQNAPVRKGGSNYTPPKKKKKR
jgi:hypothetical protein